MSPATVVTATPAEYDRTVATIGAAFVADPLMRWIFPDAHDYLTYYPSFARHLAGGAFDHSTAYRSEDFRGTALWLPPCIGPDGEALGAVLYEALAPGLLAEVGELFERIRAHHPTEPHWYLAVIGVDPPSQGQGYGSALLAHALEVCDRDHLPAYLESSNPVNIPLYQRFGFEISGECQAGSSPVVTPMFRHAR